MTQPIIWFSNRSCEKEPDKENETKLEMLDMRSRNWSRLQVWFLLCGLLKHY